MSCATLKHKFEKLGVFYIFNNVFLAITISRGDKCRGSYTPIDREFQGGLNDISCAALKRKFEIYGVFFISNNSFLVITISRDDKNRGSYTSIDREFQCGPNDMSCVSLKRKFEMSGVLLIFNNNFLAITISRGEKFMVRVHQSIENFQGGSTDMSCVVLNGKLKTYGAFFIFNNSFLAITISRDDKHGSRMPQSIENFDPVIPICVILH